MHDLLTTAALVATLATPVFIGITFIYLRGIGRYQKILHDRQDHINARITECEKRLAAIEA